MKRYVRCAHCGDEIDTVKGGYYAAPQVAAGGMDSLGTAVPFDEKIPF